MGLFRSLLKSGSNVNFKNPFVSPLGKIVLASLLFTALRRAEAFLLLIRPLFLCWKRSFRSRPPVVWWALPSQT